MTEPLAYLPERIHLELAEVELVLRGLELLGSSDDPLANEAERLYQRLLVRVWPELGDLNDGEEGT